MLEGISDGNPEKLDENPEGILHGISDENPGEISRDIAGGILDKT